MAEAEKGVLMDFLGGSQGTRLRGEGYKCNARVQQSNKEGEEDRCSKLGNTLGLGVEDGSAVRVVTNIVECESMRGCVPSGDRRLLP